MERRQDGDLEPWSERRRRRPSWTVDWSFAVWEWKTTTADWTKRRPNGVGSVGGLEQRRAANLITP
nr:hypothetical protein Iba_chr02fCG10130 [Ipomoea batatas]GMD97325.1 hypothetical protein Iba_chr15cCG1540 [Ipomoea batatas]GME17581.1 hypothetical protein Iba_scaffold19043CG0030 [Ipomoea batatas]